MASIVFLVILSIGLLIGLAYALGDIIGDMTRSRTVLFRARKWYNPPRGKDYEEDEKKEWDFIRNVLLLNNYDPLIVSESSRERIRTESIVLLFILLFLLIGVVIFWERLDVIELKKYEPVLLPLAVFVGAVMVAIGTFFTIRVNGRASSRQEWIGEVRGIVADLVSGMPESGSDRDLCQLSTSEHKFRKLELRLNPSEKMHRSLLYAISLAYDADWLNNDEVEENLRLRNSGDWHDDKLRKAGIIRLSQVALKREWEQTKRLR